MPRYKLHDIAYDIDEAGDDDGLPKELYAHFESDSDVEYNGADYISDETGFCVINFKYDLVD